MPTTHAVIDDTGAYDLEDQLLQPFKRQLRHISEVEMLARRLNIHHFWIVPGTYIDVLGSEFIKEKEGYKIFIPGEKGSKPLSEVTPTTAVVKREGSSSEVVVEWAGGPKWSWEGNRQDIVDTLASLLEFLPEEMVAYSPQYIGKSRLKQDYEATNRLQSRLAKPQYDLTELPFKAGTKPELFFASKQVLARARAGMYVVSYDKNSAHPSAAQSMRTGYGTPKHIEALGPLVTPKLPGIYRVEFDVAKSKFDGARLPLIIPNEWINLDVLLFARKKGYQVDVKEGYVFEQQYQFFKNWVPFFWKIRQALKDRERFPNETARSNAESTIKSILNFTIGALKDHPNWWVDMVSYSRVARLANLEKVEEDEGKTPLYVYADDVAYILPYDTHIKSMCERSTELGGYKHRYTLQITDAMLKDLRAFAKESKDDRQQAFAGNVHGYLKRIAEEKGVLRG